MSKNYGVSHFLEDLKSIYRLTGVTGQKVSSSYGKSARSCLQSALDYFTTHQVVLLMTDADIKNDAFLDLINQILSTGEVSGMYARDELESIAADIRPIMRQEGKYPRQA